MERTLNKRNSIKILLLRSILGNRVVVVKAEVFL